MVICCYYKYGYCYYCSPDKAVFCFFYIVIWRPAGQRHYMTMVEMNPSLYSECDESLQELGAETGILFPFFFFLTLKQPKLPTMLAQKNVQCYL